MQALIKLQLGPVQDFIVQARSTRDLWSSSYLLSWLMAAAIRGLLKQEDFDLIYPAKEGQPLLEFDPQIGIGSVPANLRDHLLIPNLPNLAVARVPLDRANEIGKIMENAIREEWEAIAASVWEERGKLEINNHLEATFNHAVSSHLSISWTATPIESRDYSDAYRTNGWHLDAIRQTRNFAAAENSCWHGGKEKDSLSGKEIALCGGTVFREKMQQRSGEIPSLFKHSDDVGAVTLIKRIWHITYLAKKQNIRARSKEFPIRSIPAIAARKNEIDDERRVDESSGGDKYIAVIAFDGDTIGKWVSGDLLPPGRDLEQHHRDFSSALGAFALQRVRSIVEQRSGVHSSIPLGQLIYAGGDDVVAIVPADVALEIADELREAFRQSTKCIQGKSGMTPDASVGIAIGHIHAPLQDLVREAQKAEKDAKNKVGRPAFSITLMKRSGEISKWGSQWESGGKDLYQQIAQLMDADHLSAKFPHRVCALLEPYLSSQIPMNQTKPPVEEVETFPVREVIIREFMFAVSRQSRPGLREEEKIRLIDSLKTYLGHLEEQPPKTDPAVPLSTTLLTTLIGLCTSVAFAHRNRPQPSSPLGSRHPAAVA